MLPTGLEPVAVVNPDGPTHSQEKLGRSPLTKTKLTLNMLKTGENLVAAVAQRLQPAP